MFQVDEEAEGLQASILSCSADVALANNKLTNKLSSVASSTARTNGPLEASGSGNTQQQGTKSSTSSNEMTH